MNIDNLSNTGFIGSLFHYMACNATKVLNKHTIRVCLGFYNTTGNKMRLCINVVIECDVYLLIIQLGIVKRIVRNNNKYEYNMNDYE